MCLSRFHVSALPSHAKPLAIVAPNGIDPAYFVDDGADDPRRFVYASNPARGLVETLRAWPAIRSRLPDAELYVCEGRPKASRACRALRLPSLLPHQHAHAQPLSAAALSLAGRTWAPRRLCRMRTCSSC